jgi:hypothetical protein
MYQIVKIGVRQSSMEVFIFDPSGDAPHPESYWHNIFL